MQFPEKRISDVLDVVCAYANLDFSKKAEIGNNRDMYDALSAGVNMLGEELRESTVSLREKEALVKEVHHRVKNNLQIILSLLSLQETFIRDKKAKQKFRDSWERVRSMALIHEMLYLSKKISEINFAEYLETLVKSAFDSYNVNGKKVGLKIDINIQNKYFDIDTSIPCGLIVNEILSNSFKYAFPNGKNGTVGVQLRNISPKKFLLVVEDNGSGFRSNNKNSDTFGLQLINTLVEQINGKLRFETGKSGTKYSISFSMN